MRGPTHLGSSHAPGTRGDRAGRPRGAGRLAPRARRRRRPGPHRRGRRLPLRPVDGQRHAAAVVPAGARSRGFRGRHRGGTGRRRRGRAARRPQLGGPVRHLLALRARRAVAVLDDRGDDRDAGRHPRRRHAVRGLPGARRDGRGGRRPRDRRGAAARRRTARGVGPARLRDPHRRRCRAATPPACSPATRCWSSVSAVSASRPSTGARLAGAGRIIAVDVSDSKESLARTAGATDFLVASPDLAKQVRAPHRRSRRRPGAGVRRLGDHDPSGLDRRTPRRHLRRRRRRPEGPAGHLQPARALPLLADAGEQRLRQQRRPPRHRGPPASTSRTAASTSPPPSPTGSPSPTSRRPSSGCNAARAAGRS